MSDAIRKLLAAQETALKIRPAVGGFPYLAEVLRQAGVSRYLWQLPACQSIYFLGEGPVVVQGTPLFSGPADIAPFDREALIGALRASQRGETTFPEFLAAAWRAGVVEYEADLNARHVRYSGCHGESYLEQYPAVVVKAG